MRIALVTNSFFPLRGGLEQHVGNLARELRAYGDQVEILTRTPGPDAWHKIPVQRLSSTLALPFALRRFAPDVIHAHGARRPFAACSLLAARQLRIPSVFTAHCYYPAHSWSSALKKGVFDSTLGWLGLQLAGTLIALTENDKRDAILLGAPAQNFRVIPNALRLPEAAPSPLPGSPHSLLFVGRLDPVKRVDFLLSALAELPGHDLTLIGPDGGHRATLEAQAHSLGLSGRVHFLGEVDDETLAAAYVRCGLFVLPSAYEGLPTVALEAMAAGRPVLAAASGGTRYLIRSGENGFLFDPHNLPELISLIRRCSSADLARLGAVARQTILENFTWEVNGARIRSIYHHFQSGAIGSGTGRTATCSSS
jgi:glycosyltransferase involved in cell wall biosynthesis